MKNWKLCAACLVSVLAIACSGNSTDDPFGGAGQGAVTIQVYDTPVSNLQAADLQFTDVWVHAAGGDWTLVGDVDITVDLMAHVGPANAVTIASGSVDPGTYDAIRFTITAATLTVEGEPEPVDLPLPAEGVTAVVQHVFTVAEGGSVEVEMHLNPATSFQVSGTGYTFIPTVDEVASH